MRSVLQELLASSVRILPLRRKFFFGKEILKLVLLNNLKEYSLLSRVSLIAYIDDIMILTTEKEHHTHVNQFLEALKDNDLAYNFEKSEFCKSSIEACYTQYFVLVLPVSGALLKPNLKETLI
ncbi:unnamed protein product [Lepeophtheirus salmonis]|uniref:(salmon louse) hypothetical protein n=1 Tax=Lepeophtheirus salmonis TaxID=72036 RepID=A0A7R8H7A5_LEPSM|nr:unnamed protein product [Lepeophtheirus salmonis]CAF2916986.1 unnamed protein product [Lepeophtheirus salmonis]